MSGPNLTILGQYYNDEWLGAAPLNMNGQLVSFVSVQFVAEQQDAASAEANFVPSFYVSSNRDNKGADLRQGSATRLGQFRIGTDG